MQKILPHKLISKLALWLANSQITWLKNKLINFFLSRYPVEMHEAEQPNPLAYNSFNAFFTRKLKSHVRTAAPNSICAPADGKIAEIGNIADNTIIQAKNINYSLATLIPTSQHDLTQLNNSIYITTYLAPINYHRVHCPYDAILTDIIYVPGKLFSVNPLTVQAIPNLFSKNERVICWFTSNLGPIVVILVGAMIVGGIEIFNHPISAHANEIKHLKITPTPYATLMELGCFKLGSTVITILPQQNIIKPVTYTQNQIIRVGDPLATITK